MPDYTADRMAEEIIAALDPTYDLVYVGRGDGFSKDQVDAIVRSNFEGLWSTTEDWESNARWESVREIIRLAADDVAHAWHAEDGADGDAIEHVREDFDYPADAWGRVREVIEDRDTGNWVRTLLNNTPDVLLRLAAPELDEDHAQDDYDSAGILSAIGAEASEHNLNAVQDALNNACTSVLMGYWVVRADVSAIYDLTPDARVEITNPYLFIGNPFSGAGWITDNPLHHTITVDRKDLVTDRDAFGYGVDEIFGGLCLNDSDMRTVEKVEESK